jgi:PKD repeat protein
MTNTAALTVALLLCIAPVTNQVVEARPVAQAAQKGLKIVVLEGEGAVNIIQQRTAVAPVVEVRDDNDLPVAGVLLRFRAIGKSAVFPGGQSELTLTTNAAGRATATGLQPVQSGAYQIQVTAEYQGQTVTSTITQNNFATVADAKNAGRTPSAGGAAAVAAAGGGGLSKAAIFGIAGAGAAGVAVAAAAGGGGKPAVASTPAPPVATNAVPVIAGLTASRSTALLGTEISFSAQASDANSDPLTYAWAFGDGAASTEPAPRHTYNSAGAFTAQLTVSDGKGSATQQTAITIKSLTGTYVANALFFITDPGQTAARSVPNRMVMTLAQSGTTVTGQLANNLPPNERNTGVGNVTGSVNKATPTVQLLARFPQVSSFTTDDTILSLEPGPDVNTLVGATSRQTITFTRQ